MPPTQRLTAIPVAIVTVVLVLISASAYGQEYDPLPGIDSIGLGWIPQDDTFGRPIFDLTYTRRLTIKSPFDGNRYAIPDYLGAPGAVRTAQKFNKFENNIYNSTNEYVTSKSSAMNIGFKYPGLFEFRMESINYKMKSNLNKTFSSFALTGEKHLYWSINAPPPQVSGRYLSSELKTMVKRTGGVFLPNNARNRKTWHSIFTYYGTHFPSQIALGGEVLMETRISSRYLRRLDESRVKRGLTIAFGAFTTPGSSAPSTPTAPQDPTSGVPNDEPVIPTPTVDHPDPNEGSDGAQPEPEPEPQPKPEPTPSPTASSDDQPSDGAKEPEPSNPGDNQEEGLGNGSEETEFQSASGGSSGPASIPGIPWGLSFSMVRESFRRQLDSEFVQSTQQTIRLIGGRTDSIRPSAWRSWVPSIIEIPEPIEKKLTPLIDVLEDHPDIPKSADIREHYERALEDYRQWWMSVGYKEHLRQRR